MNKFLLGVGISIIVLSALLVETTWLNFPFIFLIGAVLLLLIKRVPMYVIVFIMGILIDSLRITNFGLTPIFLLGTAGIVFLYERYSGSSDPVVAGFVIAVMAIAYSHFLNYSVFATVGFLALLTILWVCYRLYARRAA